MKRFTVGNISFDERRQAARFLRGSGIEIGGAYLPIPVDPRCCTVQYVDRMTASELLALFPEVQGYSIVEPDILCDVVTKGLSPFGDESQDFVIASHLIEHLPNPLGFIQDCYRVLRQNGVLYLVVPEKNFTFDRNRAVTPLAHLVEDMRRDVHEVDEDHLEDWLRYIRGTSIPVDPAEKQRVFRWELERSIHVHVWTWEGMVEFLRHLIANEKLAWELCEFYLPKKRQDEVVFVLRKTSGLQEEVATRFDATIETLLARENAMKAVIQSVDEQTAKADASRRLIPWLPPLGIQRTVDRIRHRLAARQAGAGSRAGGEKPYERSAYKATWTDLSTTVDQAKMHVAGYVEEDKFRASAEDTKKVLLETVGIRADDVVLEIGCGVGRVGQVLAPLCKEWIGCDVSPNMLKHAAERLRERRNVRFVELSGYDLKPIADQSVDVVYCTVVFMHLDEWDRYRYVLEARRILRPGGRIYIDNFNLCGEEGWAIFDRHRAIPPAQRPAHISVSSTPQEIEMYLKKAGFESVTVESHSLWARGWGRK
ncbi:MAG TPA: methyltransferase domain-containing protein [Nitrospiria bacterium]|nr:methyltransferase domain-containing protein [Nitrospiria bacterium]